MIQFSPNVSALQAFATGVQATAHNVANVSTQGFEPVSVHYQSGRPGDQGVQAVVSRSALPSEGLPVINDLEAAWAAQPFSKTDLGREMTNLILTQRAFEANAAFIRTGDDILGLVVDMVV